MPPRPARCRRSAPFSMLNRLTARVTVSGYEGSELLVARLMVEAGAEVPYVGTALPRTEWSDPDREWLEARGVHIQYRASLEQDMAAMMDAKPDLAIGTTPLVQKAKELGIPAIYFTNMVSARPLFGPAGAAAITSIVATQTRGEVALCQHGVILRQGRDGRGRGLWLAGCAARAPRGEGTVQARARGQDQGRSVGGDLRSCWFSTMIARGDIGAPFMPSPRCAG